MSRWYVYICDCLFSYSIRSLCLSLIQICCQCWSLLRNACCQEETYITEEEGGTTVEYSLHSLTVFLWPPHPFLQHWTHVFIPAPHCSLFISFVTVQHHPTPCYPVYQTLESHIQSEELTRRGSSSSSLGSYTNAVRQNLTHYSQSTPSVPSSHHSRL